MIIHLQEEKLEDLLKEGKVLVDFYADWCGPCQMLKEELEDLVEDAKDIKIVKVDVDKHEDLARQYQVMSIPMLYAYQDGKEVNHTLGFHTKEDLLALFEEE